MLLQFSVFHYCNPHNTALSKVDLIICFPHLTGSGRSPRGGNGNPLPGFLPGKSCGQKSLVGYSPWGCKESDMTECVHHTHTHAHTLT